MSNLRKIFLLTILIIVISFSSCFAIDENQFLSNTDASVDSTATQTTSENYGDNSQVENVGQVDATTTDSDTSTVSSNPISSSSTVEDQQSTTVSSVSSVRQNSSTISNILNIALIVIGILLILLAIAILLRLH